MHPEISRNDLEKWTDYLLNYSLGGIQKDDVVMIKGENICWPLMSVLQDKIFAAGGIADINIVAPDNDRGKVWGNSIAIHGSTEQINKIPQWHVDRYKTMTKYIEILGVSNPDSFQNSKENLAKEIMKVDALVKDIRLAKPWVLTLFPTKGFADMEGMTLREYSDFIVKASTVDPRLLDAVEEDIYQLLKKSSEIRIQTVHPKTKNELKLKLNIAGRNIIKCTGENNFPDGEVFTSPDANSVDGEIFVDLPVFQGGMDIQGIYLSFEGGVIKEYSAEQGFEALKKIIETDEGSHRLGEVALGMNNGMDKVLKHPLFVEKVGGTLHIAIGQSYPDAYVDDHNSEAGKNKISELTAKGIYNKSAQHVDIVTDFRPGGSGKAVYVDDVKLEIENNIWVVPNK
ncbi:MAG: aminopeptidase [Ignavibacteriaceae bacterium]|nr:aminopeptidase [Ignavibacteriaceae bacterium]MCW9096688.1 aminopeptidase [Ignavibacteriaceae bacterium]